MPYAISIVDLHDKLRDDFGLSVLLNGLITADAEPVETEPGRFDGMGIKFNCNDERGAAVVELIRNHYRPYQLRCYHSRTGNGNWKRV